jgi:predicted secreted Zn-dependent protease
MFFSKTLGGNSMKHASVIDAVSLGLRNRAVVAAVLVTSSMISSAEAASVTKQYSYFDVSGQTTEDIDGDLEKHGPIVNGVRTPGATRLEFKTTLGYREANGTCRIVSAKVNIHAELVLPRWRGARARDRYVRLMWETLSADIKRVLESRIPIAKKHAREMERSVMTLGTQKSCQTAQAKAKSIHAQILKRHDAEQDEFNQKQAKGAERRLLGQFRSRLKPAGPSQRQRGGS